LHTLLFQRRQKLWRLKVGAPINELLKSLKLLSFSKIGYETTYFLRTIVDDQNKKQNGEALEKKKPTSYLQVMQHVAGT
jgi:hypothetical protein